MDGLERIIAKIEADAEVLASAAVTEAEMKAAEIIARAESDAAVEAADIIAAAKAEREAMIRKAHSGGELLRRKKILSRKVEMIDGTVSKAVESFMREDPSEYFKAMIRLAVRYAPDGDLEMVFSDKDIGRMPSDFTDDVNSAVGKYTDITVRGGGSFDGGFLLVGSEVVENCTLAALVDEADTEIRDELCRILFV